MRNYGSGTIYQRKDGKQLWVFQMVLKNNRYSESFQSREEAEDWLKRISFFLNNADNGNSTISFSFSSYIDVWLKSVDPNLDLEMAALKLYCERNYSMKDVKGAAPIRL
jgi:hypothetical protein